LFRIGVNSVAHGNLHHWAATRKAGPQERQAKRAYSLLPGHSGEVFARWDLAKLPIYDRPS
jgi:hypothetical protein